MMFFLQLTLAVAVGVSVPLLVFACWLSSRMDWYGGEVLAHGLDKIKQACLNSNTSDLSDIRAILELFYEKYGDNK